MPHQVDVAPTTHGGRRSPRVPTRHARRVLSAASLLATTLVAACDDATAPVQGGAAAAGSGPALIPLPAGASHGPRPLPDRAGTAGPAASVAPDLARGDATGSAVPSAGSVALLWTNPTTGERWGWPMNGTQRTGEELRIGTTGAAGWAAVATGDLDADGILDIVWENAATGEHGAWTMSGAAGTTWTGHWYSFGVSGAGWRIVAAADFTGDGRADLLWEHVGTGERGISQLAGMAFAGYQSLGGLSRDWRVAAAADLTGDGRPDAVLQSTTTGEIGVWPMNGAQWGAAGTYRAIGTVSGAWRVAAAADFDGDGQADLLLDNGSARKVSIWGLTGGQDNGTRTDMTGAGSPWRLAGILGRAAAGGGGAGSGVVSISIGPPTSTIAVGATVQLGTAVTTTGAGVSADVTYASSAPGVATVDALGLVHGVSPGVASIVATSVAAPSFHAAATVTVVAGGSVVSSLVVAPASVTMAAATTRQLTPTVTLAGGAPAGTPTGVTYTSSDPAVATVSSTGLITSVADGTAIVTVRAVAAPSVAQTIPVIVRDPVAPQLSIQQLRVIDPTTFTLTPANVQDVSGRLYTTLGFDPGDFLADSLRVRVGSNVEVCTRFSVRLLAAYRLALTTGSADVQPLECGVNTAAFDQTTGVPRSLNGAQPLVAELYYRPMPDGATQVLTATIGGPVTLNNTDGAFVRVTNTPTAAQAALDPDGKATGPTDDLWRAGSIDVTVLPVRYSGAPAAPSYVVSLQDVNGVVAQRAAVPDASGNGFTATFSGATADAFDATPALTARVLDGYTSPNAGQSAVDIGGSLLGGTAIVLGTSAGAPGVAVLDAAGAPAGLTPTMPTVVSTPILVDNQAPQPAVGFGQSGAAIGPPSESFFFTGSSFVGFINGDLAFPSAFTPLFRATASDPSSALTTTNADFGGVDAVTTTFHAGASTDAATLTAGPVTASGAALAPAASNSAYKLAVALTDALGNRRSQRVQSTGARTALTFAAGGTAVTGGASVTFGVDLTAPDVMQTAGPTSNVTYQSATPPGVSFGFAGMDDTGFGLNSILATITRTARATSGDAAQTVGGALQTFCAVSIDPMTTVLHFSAAPGGTCAPIASFGTFVVPPLGGQYDLSVRARDMAGNVSASSITRIITIDVSVP